MPLAALAAAAVGAGASIYGAKKSSDSAQDIADSQNPYDVARANFQTNNPNKYTPFGSVEYFVNKGNPNDPTDDRYSMQQTYSPQMQQLMDSMLGIAGAAPATYSSSMPSGLRDKMAGVFGSDVPESNYTASIDGFKQQFRPGAGQVMEGFNPNNFDDQGNVVNNDPYEPFNSGAQAGVGDPTTDKLLNITPSETTNRQILDQLYNNGYITEYDYETMLKSFQKSGVGSGFGWGRAQTPEQMIGWLPDDLHPNFRQVNENIFNARFSYDPNYDPFASENTPQQPNTEASPAGYDRQALDALIQAMQGQGGF